MTLAQIEERIVALENAVAELRQFRLQFENDPAETTEDELIPGTEYPLVLAKLSAETIRCQAIIKWIEETPSQGLGLSDAEWASLGLEESHE